VGTNVIRQRGRLRIVKLCGTTVKEVYPRRAKLDGKRVMCRKGGSDFFKKKEEKNVSMAGPDRAMKNEEVDSFLWGKEEKMSEQKINIWKKESVCSKASLKTTRKRPRGWTEKI